jgi:hypothetical protein
MGLFWVYRWRLQQGGQLLWISVFKDDALCTVVHKSFAPELLNIAQFPESQRCRTHREKQHQHKSPEHKVQKMQFYCKTF